MKTNLKQSFPKKIRICRSKDFKIIFENGTRLYFDNLLLYIYSQKSEVTRLGIIVSRKIHKSAVIRNKFKRRIREIFRKNRSNIKPGYDILVLGTNRCVEENFEVLKQKFLEVLKKENLWIQINN